MKKRDEKGTALRNTHTLVRLHILGFYGISQGFFMVKIFYKLHSCSEKIKVKISK